MTLAPTMGVMRWLSADSRTSASWPTLTCEMSLGFTCASMMRSSPIGRSSRITAPEETTPPGVWKFFFTTMPRTGERTSIRSTTSWAARICWETAQLEDQRKIQNERLKLSESFVSTGATLSASGAFPAIELKRREQAALEQKQNLAGLDQQITPRR